MSVRKEIDQQNAKFMEYFKKQDAKALASLYTSDACLMGGNMPIVQGDIESFWVEFFKSGKTEMELMTQELFNAGDIVAERSNYKMTLQPPEMDPIVDVGKYVVVWKKTPEGYKIHWDIMNSDLPPPPT